MGLKLKVLTSKADPQMFAITKIWKKAWRKTKGLKILKIERDYCLLCLTNPYRRQEPVGREPGLDSTKTISIPLNF
jgi:hypothetical protein